MVVVGGGIGKDEHSSMGERFLVRKYLQSSVHLYISRQANLLTGLELASAFGEGSLEVAYHMSLVQDDPMPMCLEQSANGALPLLAPTTRFLLCCRWVSSKQLGENSM